MSRLLPRSASGRAWSLIALPVLLAATPVDPPASAQDPAEELVRWWRFDEPGSDGALEEVTGQRDPLHGPAEHVAGVHGTALKLDGFRTYVQREQHGIASPSEAFTVEAWMALASYPWSWAPVVDSSEPGTSGFFLGVDPVGHVGFQIAAGGAWHELVTEGTIPLRTWIHLAAVFEPDRGITVYVDGEPAAHTAVRGRHDPSPGGALTLGRSRVPRTWQEPQLTTEDATFFLDGLLDEVRITRGARSADELRREVAAAGELPAPALSDRSRLPTGPVGSGSFGAFHARLDYYPEWDALWRVGDAPDVFVRFDASPVQLVFWRGTSFVPCWVTENDVWYTNEWLETWGSDVVSCAEPIMDRDCRYSHVRILESTDARVVVHWRYALNDARYDFAAVGDDGRGEWCDEVHVIYPDQIGVRRMELRYSKPERKHDWVEQIVVLPPGRYPDDVIERDAVSLVNMQGEVKAYSWHEDFGVEMTEPAGANISYVHLRSRHRPFVVVPDGPVETVEGTWNSPFFRAYASRMARGYSPDPPPTVYGWWNHWPVAQIPGDGRWVLTPDRPSHFNLTTFVQWQDHERTERTRTRIMLQGMTDEDPAELVPLARSWLRAPAMTITSGPCAGGAYDPAERAYVLDATDAQDTDPCTLVVQASEDSPLVHPALLVRGWGGTTATLAVDGAPVEPGTAFRQGLVQRAAGVDLVVWMELEATEPVTITLGRAASSTPR